MWDNPYYFFRIPHTDRVGNRIYKEIIINVILSARYLDPKQDMRNVLNVLIGSDSENFRLHLIDTFRQVIKNSLNLLGIEIMEEM